MSLVIEDGTGVVNANTYQSLIDARNLAANVGVTLPADDAEAEKALINGAMYLQSYESKVCGTRTVANQALMFPRHCASLHGSPIDSDSIPRDLLIAQLLAAEDFSKGGNAWGEADDGRVTLSEQVDVISVSYANNGVSGSSYTIPRLDSIMDGFCAKSGGGSKRLERVF